MINEDLTRRVQVHAGQVAWVPSPTPGIERRMLFRIGEEQARATSIVRYAPGSHFPRHAHPGGEEILVLEGVFQDETGDYSAGSYLRNPPRSAHAPGSETGCVIFVKLWQFSADDHERVARGPADGLLFERPGERVVVENVPPGRDIAIDNPNGLELLVLGGTLHEGANALETWSWLRLPPGESFRAVAGSEGARIWHKTGALLHADVCPFNSEGAP